MDLRPASEIGSARLDHRSSDMALSEPIVRLTSPPIAGNTDGDVVDLFVPRTSPGANHAGVDIPTALSQVPSTSLARGSSPGRIEDSVEALDRLEDDLEALHIASQVQQLISTGERHQPRTAGSRLNTSGISGNLTGLVSKSASVRVRPAASRPSLRRSASMNLGGEEEARTTPSTQSMPSANKKLAATRNSGMEPQKGAIRSTKPTFELPGEAVARRLKEQREVRRSMQVEPASPAPTVPQRTRSLKTPTVARFELPGEAISRRKKEQHEAQLRKEAIEEQKRREFKAAPVRSSAPPSSYPRETAASRARRVKATGEEGGHAPVRQAATAPTSAASKRSSVVGPASHPSLRKSASTISNASTASTVSRGRMTGTDESQTSRNTSASAGNASVKRSTVSHEDVERQRLRGKEIYNLDNSYAAARDQERRQREMAAKAARDRAAMQGRMASREWAERQRQQRRVSTAVLGDRVAASM
ncbi:hypothetical protein F5X68DRAFT_212996 [Plectosphaerella plurivora]|uniref:TPX2 C-terminal domain-containing protein n=1 Tax=Plectosphaerella plurivora TaxID=936078 RepID=A0A9P9A619_9PEZI|nr:hypothetical protein F5X68DRAFT_212996 [Plectosphaerella plurivora]